MGTDAISSYFEQVAQIACICPEYSGVFRHSDARPYRVARPAPSQLDEIDRQERLLQAAIDKLELIEDDLREAARKSGLRQAQKQFQKSVSYFRRGNSIRTTSRSFATRSNILCLTA